MKRNILLMAMSFIALSALAQNNRFWQPIRFNDATSKAKATKIFSGSFKPAAYNLYNLDANALKSVLWSAPRIRTVDVKNSPAIIYVPIANGKIERFTVVEAPVMEDRLAAKYSSIKSFVAQGIDDASAVLHCDFTPEGFFGVIHSSKHNTLYVNCIDKSTQLYAVYERSDNDLISNSFKCNLDKSIIGNATPADKTTYKGNADDGILRQYRLALCVTGEFSQTFTIGAESHQDSLNQVMAAITTDLVRANAVYEPDFDITMVFVNNEDTLIFLNPNTDPFTLSNLNSKCQSTCDSRIGNANYDIGHVLAKGSDNGNAGCIGCVCKNSKGSGATTYHDPTLTDYMVIDYWAHEMGHQYGANHTFTFSYEGTNAQIEPGSGSTIMSYAGITGNTDVQPHSDDYFSCASVAQVSNYIKSGTGGGQCSVNFATGDAIPTANAGKNYTIPISTPFVLKGTGTDADLNDTLSYDWEQTDVYQKNTSNTFPKATSTTGPTFRSFLPTSQPVRYFPALSTVLTGSTGTEWEQLTSVTRDLNFRITVRDNHAGGGSNKSDDVLIKVTNTAGPFTVSSPNTNITWAANSNQTVTWNVANTNVAPVSCTNVQILLSVDGGNTFPYILANKTANDGSQSIKVPNVSTTQARIEVASVKNVFYDISDQNFTITQSPIVARDLNENNFVKWSVQPNPAQNFIQVLFNEDESNAIVSLMDVSGRTIYSSMQSQIQNGQTMSIDARNFNSGVYFLQVKNNGTSHTEKVVLNK